jgi:hypothetical protein
MQAKTWCARVRLTGRRGEVVIGGSDLGAPQCSQRHQLWAGDRD